MCGIAGYFAEQDPNAIGDRLKDMGESLRHRGPDGGGFAMFGRDLATTWQGESVDPQVRGGFAHRRLAIQDLSAAADQPMTAAAGRYWLSFNGEIYNFIELRQELESLGHTFKSTSDTEVLLACLVEWGVDCLPKMNGMWAFSLWDRERRELLLARDRFGIKPLYFVHRPNFFAFASEIKALLTIPELPRKRNRAAIADYLAHSRVDSFDFTFFQGIQQLRPGHVLRLRPFDENEAQQTAWWSLAEAVDGISAPSDFDEAAEEIAALFTDSVKIRLRSDVPVGTCLSGGIDSSAVVCTAGPHMAPNQHRSFSVCCPDYDRDESRWIDMVVEKTGVTPFRVEPAASEFQSDFDRLLQHQEQPFRSTSIYAQWKVFELARRHDVVVTLDGQGADESLAGYHYLFPVYYASLLRKGRILDWLSQTRSVARRQELPWIRQLASSVLGVAGHRQMIRLAGFINKQYAGDWIADDYRHAARELKPDIPAVSEPFNRRLAELFTCSGLPALLRYADHNSMAHSVESRMPFMDHRLVSLIFALPPNHKIREGQTKAVFRHAMRDTIPAEICARQDKIGFEIPEDSWLRDGFSHAVSEMVESPTLKSAPWLDYARFRALWQLHLAGRVDAGRIIFRVYCLHRWEQIFLGGD